MDFFCSLPFDSLIVYPGGYVNPCCKFENLPRFKLDNYFNNKRIINIKKQLLNNEVPVECRTCKRQEDQTGSSLRTINNTANVKSVERFKSINDPTIFDIKNLDLVTSNVCNLQCLPCEYGSYTRNAEFHKMGLQKTVPIKFVLDGVNLLPDLNLDRITFYGGEPFSDKITFQIIEKLIESGKSKKIRLDINTNVTLITKSKLNLLKNNFREVFIKASVDGFQKANNYLRYPSEWHEIETGIDLMKEVGINFSVTVALSNLALLTLYELINWVVKEKEVIDIFFSHVEELKSLNNPYVLKYNHLPKNLKDNLLSKFVELSKDTTYSSTVQELIKVAISICHSHGEDIRDLIEFLKVLDKHRGTNFIDVWPELLDYE